MNYIKTLLTESLKEALKTSLGKRLFGNIIKRGGHWIFQGHTTKLGYAQFWYKGKVEQAHRIAWLITHGKPAPAGKIIRHTCGVKNCINPDHLKLSKSN